MKYISVRRQPVHPSSFILRSKEPAVNLDHAVIVVQDLERAIADYTELGFTVTPGGEHADGRTHNALIPFADGTYLELIAFRQGVEAADHPWWRAKEIGGGLTDWALQTTDLAARVDALRAAGLPFEAPKDGGRLRLDGEQLLWKGARPAANSGLPFLIEDVTPRSLRVPSGAAAEHANGAMGLDQVAVAVPDLLRAAEQYRTLLDAESGEIVMDQLLGTEASTLPCGAALISLVTATSGPIDDRLARAGAGPYALVLRGKDEDQGWLDLQGTHGARLFLRPTTNDQRPTKE
jgi:catechol 2,3-dioxygenase-like lactoylglutathione lyase family enzyme